MIDNFEIPYNEIVILTLKDIRKQYNENEFYYTALSFAIESIEHNEIKEDNFITIEKAIDVAIEAVDEWDGGSNQGRDNIIKNAFNSLPSKSC